MMGLSYICKWGLYHDRPCINKEPSSNNGFTYTSMAKFLGLPIDTKEVKRTYIRCKMSAMDEKLYFIHRLPGKRFPPISRDEILGMYALGFDPIGADWLMYKDQGRVIILRSLKALWDIREEHRNTFWEEEILDAYPLAMKLWHHDRYFINRMNGDRVSLLEFLVFHVHAISTIIKNDPGESNLIWMQLSALKSKILIKFINRKANFLEYFGKAHIFNE